MKVSIIIPVFNGSNYMKEAIDSALAQTYPNVEVLVINDGSDDGGATESIALSYGDRIRYFAKPNGGVSTALNLGIAQMRGEYFSWLSHDDVYKPEKIQRQIKFLDALDDPAAILYGGYELIDGKSKTFDIIDYFRLYPEWQLNVSLFPVFRGLANGCTMLVHKSHFERTGGFLENLRTTQDYELWFRMFREAKVRCCPGIFVKTRFHPNQTGRKAEQHNRDCDALWIDMLNRVTDNEMRKMEGTVYHFYKRTAEYLRRNSLYREAQFYAEGLERSELLKLGGNEPPEVIPDHNPTFKSQGFWRKGRRLLYNLRTEGINATLRKIERKFR